MRVLVTGESMRPALLPGDWLLAARWVRIRPGDVVIARHPADRERLIVKRAARRERDGWWLESDNQRAPGRQDSWDFGPVADELIVARALIRYWPLRGGALPVR